MNESAKNVLRPIVGMAWLFSLGAAAFFLILAPIELNKTREAWSWLPRKVRITGSKIEYVSGETGGHTLRITVQEIDDPNQRGRARVRFGGMGHSLSFFSNLIASTLHADQAKYPVGKEMVAYRNSQANEFVLEQNDLSLMASVWVCSLLWLLLNAYWLKRLGGIHASGSGTSSRATQSITAIPPMSE